MKLIYVDDEENSIINFYCDTKNRTDITSIEFFLKPEEALRYVEQQDVDGAFLDASMPSMSGIELAKRLKEINPKIEVVFITGFADYALDAFKVGGRAYLQKPYTPEDLDAAFTLLKRLINPEKLQRPQKTIYQTSRIYIRTFGNFDIMMDGVPLLFKNSKAKELLAILVDYRGGSATNNQVFQKLWEEKEYSTSTSTYARRTIRDLKAQLAEFGISDLISSGRNSININSWKFTCDYYEVMQGNVDFAYEYNGYYMTQYYWAEETIPLIESKVNYLKKTEKKQWGGKCPLFILNLSVYSYNCVL